MALTSGYQQASKIIARAAVQSGVLSLGPSGIAAFDALGSSDPNIVQMVEILNSLGDYLNGDVDWTQLRKRYTFVTTTIATNYDLPTDLYKILPDTVWNLSQRLPGLGPMTPQEIENIRAQLIGVVLNCPWMQEGNQFVIPFPPPSDQTYAFEYLSTNWLSSDGVTPDKGEISANSDWVLFDPLMVIRAIRLQWSELKGLDTSVLERQYAEARAQAISRTRGARTLKLSGGKIIDRYLDRPSTPPTGFGQ